MKVEFEIQEKSNGDALGRKVSNTKEIYNLDEVQAIKNAIQEHFLFIGIDRNNNVRNIRLIGIGNCKNLYISAKEILRIALLTESEGVILVHNHPSNSLNASKEDKNITNRINQVLKTFDINLLDHIIVTEKEYSSMIFKEEIDINYTYTELDRVEKIFLTEENERLKEKIKNLTKKIEKNKNKYER